jgi:hypothetical protein
MAFVTARFDGYINLCGGTIISQEEIIDDEQVQVKPKKRSLPLTDYAPIGSELVFTRDENIKCTIIDKKRVRYNDEDFSSLSNLAGKLVVEKLGYKQPNVAGTDYFMFNGKILSEIRDDIFSEETD